MLDFEKSFSIFQNTLSSRLLKIVLIVTSYVIGKKTDANESFLIKHIKKLFKKMVFFKKTTSFYSSEQ